MTKGENIGEIRWRKQVEGETFYNYNVFFNGTNRQISGIHKFSKANVYMTDSHSIQAVNTNLNAGHLFVGLKTNLGPPSKQCARLC